MPVLVMDRGQQVPGLGGRPSIQPVATERPLSVSRITCRRRSVAERCLLMSPSASNRDKMRLR